MTGGTARNRRELLQRLRLLCTSGAGLQAVASSFCAATRELLGAEAGMLLWLTESGEPLGFYHETAPAELKDYFVENLDTMFNDTEEVSGGFLAAPQGPVIGKMLDRALQEKFHAGNIYRHLCLPLGHHHLLDMRAHAQGIGLAGFCVWNRVDKPFTQAHADLLQPVQPLMEQALAAPESGAHWRSITTGTPHLITCRAGQQLLVIDPEAERILMGSHLLRQNLSPIREPRQAPGFVALLAAQMRMQESAELHLPVADGRLVCRGTRTQLLSAQGGEPDHLFVSLDLQISEQVARVDHVMGLDLTGLQRDIAFFALQGGERGECMDKFGISQEALKKHLRAIFQVTGAANWAGLQVYPVADFPAKGLLK